MRVEMAGILAESGGWVHQQPRGSKGSSRASLGGENNRGKMPEIERKPQPTALQTRAAAKMT